MRIIKTIKFYVTFKESIFKCKLKQTLKDKTAYFITEGKKSPLYNEWELDSPEAKLSLGINKSESAINSVGVA